MRALKAAILIAAFVPLAWARPGRADVLVLRVGKILTATKGVINGGVIVVRDGKIAAIGAEGEVDIPEGARVIDARERWATPGFIDLHCHIGGMMGDINDMVNPTNPEMSTRPTIDPQNENLKDAVAGGVTTVLYIPGSGTNIGGFGTLMHTAGGETAEELIIRWPGGMKVAQAWNPERRGGDLGQSRMGMWWGLRQLLDRAKRYHEALTAFEKGQTKIQPEAQPDLELMRGLFQHKYPVIIHTADARDVMGTVRMFHDEYGLKMIVSHGEFGGFKVAEEIAKRDLPANIGPRLYDYEALAGHVPDGHCNGIPTKYWEGGVRRLSLCTDSPVVPQEDLVFQGTMAIHLGLDPEVALKGLTIEPARAVLIDDRKGSLEAGKDADIVVWTGDPFDVRNYTTLVVIRGKIVYDITRDRRRY
jgi:imidazolonepropionase-like amidohydrolase